MTDHAPLQQLLRFLDQDPRNLPLRAEAVQCALSLGASDEARRIIEQAPADQRQGPEMMHTAGSVLLAEGSYREAEDLLLGLAQHGPLAAGSLFNLGMARFGQQRFGDALACWQPLVERADAPAGLRAWVLRAHWNEGGSQQALAAWEAAPEAWRDSDPEAQAVAGLLYFDAGQAETARRWSDLARRGGAQAGELAVTLASLAILQGEAAGALGLIEPALARSPRDGRLWSVRATAQLRGGDLAAARSSFEQAVGFMPGHVGTWHGLAWCQLTAGDLAGAARSFEHALALDRNFGDTHGGLAVLAALQGRRDEAEAAIERALRLDPQGLAARYAQAVLSGDAQDPQALQRLARRLLGGRAAPLGGSLAEAAGLR
jgi:tetratricopeptide (TPR) repeat protein